MRRDSNGHRIARLIGRAMSPAGPRARLTVFCYHQVLDQPDPVRPGEPDLPQFRRDVETLQAMFNLLHFGEAVRLLSDGRLPERAASITFDDGYANNHSLAAPLLEAAGVPATVFVTADAVDHGVMWNDLVIEAATKSQSPDKLERLPATLRELKYQAPKERWSAAEELYRCVIGEDLPRLMMTRAMVADLHRRGFEIGGHTISHPILTAIPAQDAAAEIRGCAAWIREVTGTTPVSFAYPNGRPGLDFGPEHKEMVAAAGFMAATSTEWAVAGPGSDPLNIPRVGPWWRQNRTSIVGLVRTYAKSYLP